MVALREAEERLQREQSALQEQAKVVFAEREARLARRERELAKREAALAVSEGIASSNTGSDVGDAERAQLEASRRELAERHAELDRREQALPSVSAISPRAALRPSRPAIGSPGGNARAPELEEAVTTLSAPGRARSEPARAGASGSATALVDQLRDRGAVGSAELAEREARLLELEAELADREHRCQEGREGAHPEGAARRRRRARTSMQRAAEMSRDRATPRRARRRRSRLARALRETTEAETDQAWRASRRREAELARRSTSSRPRRPRLEEATEAVESRSAMIEAAEARVAASATPTPTARSPTPRQRLAALAGREQELQHVEAQAGGVEQRDREVARPVVQASRRSSGSCADIGAPAGQAATSAAKRPRPLQRGSSRQRRAEAETRIAACDAARRRAGRHGAPAGRGQHAPGRVRRPPARRSRRPRRRSTAERSHAETHGARGRPAPEAGRADDGRRRGTAAIEVERLAADLREREARQPARRDRPGAARGPARPPPGHRWTSVSASSTTATTAGAARRPDARSARPTWPGSTVRADRVEAELESQRAALADAEVAVARERAVLQRRMAEIEKPRGHGPRDRGTRAVQAARPNGSSRGRDAGEGSRRPAAVRSGKRELQAQERRVSEPSATLQRREADLDIYARKLQRRARRPQADPELARMTIRPLSGRGLQRRALAGRRR